MKQYLKKSFSVYLAKNKRIYLGRGKDFRGNDDVALEGRELEGELDRRCIVPRIIGDGFY